MKIKIGFKSGREITLRGIKDVTVKYSNTQITELNIKRSSLGKFLIGLGFIDELFLASVNLASIDYIILRK